MNKRPAIVTTIIVLTMAAHQDIAGSCETYKFEKTKGMELVNHVIKTVMRNVVALCWSECAWLPSCFSINVRVQGILFECDLNNSTKTAAGGLVPRVGSEYHEMTEIQTTKTCKSCISKMKDVLQDAWFRLGSIALKLFQVKKNWSEAEDHCKSIGGNLVSISSSYENDFINDVLAKVKPPSDRVHWSLDGNDKEISLESKSYTPVKARYEEVDGVKALYLTGQNSYADVPATLPFNARGYTMMVWLKPEQFTLTNEFKIKQILTDLGSGSEKSFRLQYLQKSVNYGDTLLFDVFDNSSEVIRVQAPSKSPPPDVWTHIAATSIYALDGKDMKIKLDIVVNGSRVADEWFSKEPAHVQPRPHYQLGVTRGEWSNVNNNYHGYMKDLMFFDRALNLSEIKEAMNYEEPGPWLGLSTMTTNNGWSDGSSADQYIPQGSYLPSPESELCAAMGKHGKWMTRKCSEKRSFICKKPFV